MFILTDGANTVLRTNYTLLEFRQENPTVLLPAAPDAQTLATFNIYEPQPTATPNYDPITEVCEEATPVRVDGVWTQVWSVQGASPELIAARKQAIYDDIVAQTQTRLDSFANTRGYDGILSACTYATSPTPKFASEGQYCVQQRDATWATLYTMLGEVQTGVRPMPTAFSDIESELPALVWP